MKYFLSFLLLPFICSGQKGSIEKSKFAIGLYASPDLHFHVITHRYDDVNYPINNPASGYTTGIDFTYFIGMKFSLETGAFFSNKGNVIRKYDYRSIQTAMLVPYTGPDIITQAHKRYFLDIPIKANYYFNFGKSSINITGGFSTNILISENLISIEEYSDGHKTIREYQYDNFQLDLTTMFGLAYSYNFSDKMYFKIEPIYRESVASILDNNQRDFWVGLGTSVNYNF